MWQSGKAKKSRGMVMERKQWAWKDREERIRKGEIKVKGRERKTICTVCSAVKM